jgi:imidazolonepropionase-like amidohydrolase
LIARLSVEWSLLTEGIFACQYLGFAAMTGSVTEGQDADLVILDGDPAQNVQAFSKIGMTLRHGNIVFLTKQD